MPRKSNASIGIDPGKNTLHLIGLDARGEIVLAGPEQGKRRGEGLRRDASDFPNRPRVPCRTSPRRGSARKGKKLRCYYRAGGTGAQAITHDALREIDLGRVDHAWAGIMNDPVRFQHGPAIGTPPLVRADAQGQHTDAGLTQGARFMICGHRWTSPRRKRRLLLV
jgi:hypothetical protein